MKKVLLTIAVLFCVLTLLNFYLYNEYKNEPFAYGPKVPRITSEGDNLIIAWYKNENGDTLLIQRYYWRDDYKYIYYQPTDISTNYTVNKNGSRHPLNKDETLYAADSANIKLIGDADAFLTLDYVPKKLLVKGPAADNVYTVAAVFQQNIATQPVYPFWQKLTLGPVCDFKELGLGW